MSVSKNSTAASKAVEKSQFKSKVERTPEEVIEQARRNLSVGLAVTPNDQRFILAQYDVAMITLNLLVDEAVVLKATNAGLRAKNEELRDVYEQENRSTTL